MWSHTWTGLQSSRQYRLYHQSYQGRLPWRGGGRLSRLVLQGRRPSVGFFHPLCLAARGDSEDDYYEIMMMMKMKEKHLNGNQYIHNGVACLAWSGLHLVLSIKILTTSVWLSWAAWCIGRAPYLLGRSGSAPACRSATTEPM